MIFFTSNIIGSRGYSLYGFPPPFLLLYIDINKVKVWSLKVLHSAQKFRLFLPSVLFPFHISIERPDFSLQTFFFSFLSSLAKDHGIRCPNIKQRWVVFGRILNMLIIYINAIQCRSKSRFVYILFPNTIEHIQHLFSIGEAFILLFVFKYQITFFLFFSFSMTWLTVKTERRLVVHIYIFSEFVCRINCDQTLPIFQNFFFVQECPGE